MPVSTIKRVRANPEWWFTLEDVMVEACEDPGSGLTIRYFDNYASKDGKTLLCISREDALLIRDAINQLYPPSIKS